MVKYSKNLGLDQVLAYMADERNPKTPAEICKIHDIPKQTMSYSTSKLKKLGCIERVDGQWKVLKNKVPIRPKDTSNPNSDIRGHAFIWNIEFLEEKLKWDQIIQNYKKRTKRPKFTFKKICNNKVTRILYKDRKIWLTKTGLTIYEPLDFFGESAFTVKGTAVFEMDRIVKSLLGEFKLKNQYYRFKCSREHYAHVKNQMARQFNDNKQKIKVEYEGKWFWIDHSHGEEEEETDNPIVSVQAKKFYKSQLKTDFKVTPEKILEMQENTAKQIEEVAKQSKKNEDKLEYYAENQVTHVKLMKSIDANLALQTKFFQEMKDFMLSRK